MNKFTLTLNDRLRPLLTVILVDGSPISLASLTAKFQMVDEDGTDVVAETTSNVTAHPSFTVTASASTDRITANEHYVQQGDQVVFATTTTLPAGLTASTRYYVVDVEPNSFRVSLSPNGPIVNITDAGTGTHSAYVVGSVKYDFAAVDVDTVGLYSGFFRFTGSSLTDTFPVDGIAIEIVARG